VLFKGLLANSPIKKFKVLARDHLQSVNLSKLPLALIVNCSDSNTSGSHWISFYVFLKDSRIVAEYFDSYNNPLSNYKINPPFYVKNSNSKVLQSSSSVVCGLYSLFFLYWKSRGRSIKSIESRFSSNLEGNDFKIKYYYRLIVNFKTKDTTKLRCCTRLVNRL